jgi:HD-GYP domain-containing protein (c-di-GMP phosphodiesterase class II)/CHASE1-domain containing sensor protein
MTNTLPNDTSPKTGFCKRYWPACMAAWCGLGISIAVFFSIRSWEAAAIEAEFQLEAADRATAIRTVFETQISLLESVQATFNSVSPIDRQDYAKLLAPFKRHAKSIVGVEWVPRVPHAQRDAYEKAARRDGLDGFRFTEQNAEKQIVQAADRDEYYPIYYIGPNRANPVVFGYDLASEPVRLAALREACDSEKIQGSGRIPFIQDEKIRDGFLMILPVYARDKQIDTIEQRRANFLGAIVGVFQPDILIESALDRLQPEGIDVALFDSADALGKEPFYYHASRYRNNEPNDSYEQDKKSKSSRFTTKLDVGGHQWSLVCYEIPQFRLQRQTAWSWISLAIGIASTALFTSYIVTIYNRRAYAERLVHEKRIYARVLESKVHERTEELRLAQEEIIQRLVTASLWRDEETGMHIRRTGLICEMLAKAAGWSAAEAEIIRHAAPMHDVGKIGIPDAILRKPGRLTPAEFNVIKTHTLIGAEMLADSKTTMLQMAREIALHHHEFWNGKGYPVGLSGQQIPEAARIMAIVDVFDALTHDRVYRKAMSEEAAVELMVGESGTHFDPSLLAIFVTMLPEISTIASEYPDELSNELKLARDFAAILAKSKSTEAQVLMTALPIVTDNISRPVVN